MVAKLWMIALSLVATNAYAGLLCYEYRYAPNLVRATQIALKQQGFYRGPTDGKWGPKTKTAVRKFQIAKNITLIPRFHNTVDSDEGELEAGTLRALFGDDAPAGVTQVPNPEHLPANFWAESCR